MNCTNTQARFLLLTPLFRGGCFFQQLVYTCCMDIVVLVSIMAGVAVGIAVWLLLSWTMLRRQLALEHYVKTLEEAVAARLDTLGKIKERQDKSEAAKVRWTKKELEEQAHLADLQQKTPVIPFPPGW